jgi:hypothetical protein
MKTVILCTASNRTPGVLFNFGGQKWGLNSRGFLFEGGGSNKYRLKGAKFFTCLSNCMHFYADELFPLLLIEHVNFHHS